jgi:hypothetical protein
MADTCIVIIMFCRFCFQYFLKDLCDVINQNDFKIYRAFSSQCGCVLIQCDIDCVHKIPRFSKIRLIFFGQDNEHSELSVQLGNSLILRPDCIKDLGVLNDSKCHFNRYVDFVFTCPESTKAHSHKILKSKAIPVAGRGGL